MSDTYEGGTAGDDGEVKVYVLIVEGAGVDARAQVSTPAKEKIWVPAAKIADEAGLSIEQLPGTYVIAVVRGGELAAFRPLDA